MCKKIAGAGKVGYVVYTCDVPYSTAKPGFVRNDTPHEGELQFTENIWFAKVFGDRPSMEALLQNFKIRSKKNLLTHMAVAQMAVPE